MSTLIIDDEELFSKGLGEIMQDITEEVIHIKPVNVTFIESQIDLKEFSVILININLYENFIDELNYILEEKRPDTKVVAIYRTASKTLIDFCRDNGFYGCISKRNTEQQYRNILSLILSGEKYFPTFSYENHIELTNKQKEILKLIQQGMSNKQIAYEESISESTVKVHISQIFRKFQCYNRVQLINKAKELNIG